MATLQQARENIQQARSQVQQQREIAQSKQSELSQAQSKIDTQQKRLSSQRVLRTLDRTGQVKRGVALRKLGKAEGQVKAGLSQVEQFKTELSGVETELDTSQKQVEAYDNLQRQIKESIEKNPGFISSKYLNLSKQGFEQAGLDPLEAEKIYKGAVTQTGTSYIWSEPTQSLPGGGTDSVFLGSVDIKSGNVKIPKGVGGVSLSSGGFAFSLDSSGNRNKIMSVDVPSVELPSISSKSLVSGEGLFTPAPIKTDIIKSKFIQVKDFAVGKAGKLKDTILEPIKESEIRKQIQAPIESGLRGYFRLDEQDYKLQSELGQTISPPKTIEGVSEKVRTGFEEFGGQIISSVKFGIQDRSPTKPFGGFGLTQIGLGDKAFPSISRRFISVDTGRFIKEQVRRQSIPSQDLFTVKGSQIADVGSFFVPGVGEARIGLESGAIGEKVVTGGKITGGDIAFVGLAAGSGALIGLRRAGILATKEERFAIQSAKNREIAEIGAFNLERDIQGLTKERIKMLSGLKFIDEPTTGIIESTPTKVTGTGLATLSARETKILKDAQMGLSRVSELPTGTKETIGFERNVEVFSLSPQARRDLPESIKFIGEPILKTQQRGVLELTGKGDSISGFGVVSQVGAGGRPIGSQPVIVRSLKDTEKTSILTDIFGQARKSRIEEQAPFGRLRGRELTQLEILGQVSEGDRTRRIISSTTREARISKTPQRLSQEEFAQRILQPAEKPSFVFPGRRKELVVEDIFKLPERQRRTLDAFTRDGKVIARRMELVEQPFVRKSTIFPEQPLFIEPTSSPGLGRVSEVSRRTIVPQLETVSKQELVSQVAPKPIPLLPRVSQRTRTQTILRTSPTIATGMIVGLSQIPLVTTREQTPVSAPPRTETSFVQTTSQKTKIQQEQVLKPTTAKASKVSQESSNLQINIQRTGTTKIQSPLERTKTAQISSTIQRSKTDEIFSSSQKTKTGQPRPPKKPQTPLKPIPPSKQPNLIQRVAKKVSEEPQIFKAFGRVKGEDVELGAFRSKKEAETKLRGFLKGTLGAGGFVKTKEGKIPFSELGLSRDIEFQAGKSDQLRVIQKRERRLGTRSETREIQYFKKSSPRGSNKKTKKVKKSIFNI